VTSDALACQFAVWSHDLDPVDVPAEVIAAARRAIVDTLGVMVAGGAHDSVKRIALGWPDAGGRCATIGRGPANAETAALINGMAAHVWDFDDTSYTGIMHGSAVILPVVLALAQETDALEPAMIAAFLAGSEVTYALAEICTHRHYFRGWWSTATIGLIGATTAAARMMQLSPTQTANAIGLAAAASGGGKAVFGTDGKPLLVGETARRAIVFARAAGLGLTGPVDGFENPNGFVSLLADPSVGDLNADSLGQRWRIVSPGLLFKTNPVCSAAHAVIEQLAVLVGDVETDDIAAIEAELPALVAMSLAYDRPTNPQQAQFSLPYTLACAALQGRVRLADLTAEALADPTKQRLMAKITKRVADDLSTDEARAEHPESARVTVTLRNGGRRSGFCADAYGMPSRPLSDSDLVAKFHHCLAFACIEPPKTDPLKADLLLLAISLVTATADRQRPQTA